MSSPLADAKRIPAAASSPLLSPPVDGVNPDALHLPSKKKRMDSNLPPVQKLVVPAASVSGNRSVSFRPTLTPGGVTRAVDRTARETHTRQSPQLPEATPGPSQSTKSSSGPVYPLSSTPAVSSVSSGGGKMKREKTTARPSSKRLEDEVAEVPELPAILLPISTSALPTFSFSSPLPPLNTSTSSSPKISAVTPVKETVTDKDPPRASTPPCVLFTFSSPIVKTTAASPPSFSPSAGFTFSAPVAKLGPSMVNGKLTTPIAAAVKAAVKKSTEDFEGPFKPAKTLKQGSVLDLLKAPGFASPVAQISPARDATPQQSSTQSTAPSSTSATSSTSSTGFGGLFKASADWTCDVCLVPNKQSDTKCVCCAAPQPKSSSKSMDSKQSPSTSVGLESSSSTNTTSTTTTTTGFGTMFSKPAGTWDCDTCLVINKPDAVKCVACETAKPGTGLKPSLTLSSAFSPVKTVPTPTAAVSTEFTGFGDKFKKPEGAWECDTCMVQNKAEDTKCVACTSAKPGASAGPSSSSSSAPVLGLAEKFKKPEGAWECDVCLVQNKASDVQCVACQAAKPGAKVEPKAFGSTFGSTFGSSASGTSGSSASSTGGFKFGTSDSTSASGAGGFKFGGSLTESTSSSSSGGFKFGVPFGSSSSETTSKDTTAASGFKFGGSSESFKFGAASSDDKKSDQPAAGSGFKFGASSGIVFGTGSSSTESNSSKGGFTIGLSKPEEKTSVTSTTSSSSITFTPPSSQENSNSKASSSDTDSGSVSISCGTARSVFGRLGEPSLATSAPQVVPTFGSSQAAKEPAAPTFTFGKPEEKKEAATSSAPSTFLFAAASKDADSTQAFTGGFSFSKPNAPTEQPPPAFTFGKSADKNETSSSEAPKPTFAFGKSAAEPASAAPKPAFSFLASKPTNATNSTTSSSSTPTPSLFGAASGSSTSTPAPAPSAAPNTFMFGQPAAASSDAPPAKNFIFGQSQDSQPPAPSAAPLNSTPAPAPAPAQPFIFGAPTNAAAAAAPAPAAAAAPTFNFGAAAPSAASSSAPSAGPTPFVFTSAPSAGFGNNQTPSFGSSFGSPFPATPSQTPAFGAKPNPPPAFGQQSNSTPVFGQGANPAPGGGFQFGGTGAFGATTNNTSGAPGGGFNFGQTPTFNIGSTKSFTATSGGQPAIAGRKIKTAVRRRK
ncbi:unnamed protein product [Oreochromis niloticus]|nr:unnamed protein product [Mustela putorius furo]